MLASRELFGECRVSLIVARDSGTDMSSCWRMLSKLTSRPALLAVMSEPLQDVSVHRNRVLFPFYVLYNRVQSIKCHSFILTNGSFEIDILVIIWS